MVRDISHWPQRKPLAMMMRCDIQRHGNSPVMLGTLRLTTGLGVAVATSGHFFKGGRGDASPDRIIYQGVGGIYSGGESSSTPRPPNTIHKPNDTQNNPQRQDHLTQSTTPMTKPMAKCKIKTFGGGEHCISGKIKRGVPGADIN